MSRAGAVSLTVRGESLLLHPGRAVFWVGRRTLVVADTHFGKSGVFRRHGRAAPAGSDDEDRERLSRLVDETHARRLIVLGDFLHAPLDAASEDARALAGWARRLGIELAVIAGNHDRGARAQWQAHLEWREDALVDPPFCFIHDAAGAVADGSFTLSGHVHPVVRLAALRKRGARVAVFWHRQDGLVLPSFGSFTGGAIVSPGAGERVFAIGSHRVVPFPVHTAGRDGGSRSR